LKSSQFERAAGVHFIYIFIYYYNAAAAANAMSQLFCVCCAHFNSINRQQLTSAFFTLNQENYAPMHNADIYQIIGT